MAPVRRGAADQPPMRFKKRTQGGASTRPDVTHLEVVVPTRYEHAFVFSGGGNLGSIQVGMLRALLGAGIVPDLLVGCSVGALNASFMAAGPTAGRLDTLEQLWRRLRGADIFVGTRRSQLAHLLRRRDHVYDSHGLAGIIREFIPQADLAEMAVHLEVVTTDLNDGAPRWWSTGRPVDVLCASAALPGIFPPVRLDGHMHVDGGVLSPIPVQRAIDLGASNIWVLDVGADRPVNIGDRMHALDVFMASFATTRRAMALAPVPVPDGVVVRQLPPPEPGNLGRMDFSTAGQLVDESHALAAAYLAQLAHERAEDRDRDRALVA
jgi:NTE family protein